MVISETSTLAKVVRAFRIICLFTRWKFRVCPYFDIEKEKCLVSNSYGLRSRNKPGEINVNSRIRILRIIRIRILNNYFGCRWDTK